MRLIFLLLVCGLAIGQDLSELSVEEQSVLNERLKEMRYEKNQQKLSESVNSDERMSDVEGLRRFKDSLLMKDSLEQDSLRIQDSLEVEAEKAQDSVKRFITDLFSLEDPSIFAATPNLVSPDYLLKEGDKLSLNIWGDELSEELLEVDHSGNIIVKNLGGVSVNGMSISRAEKLILRKLKKNNLGVRLGKSYVSLHVKEMSDMKVYVLGDVVRPSAYVLSGNSSVLNALYMAGGPSQIGSARNIVVRRGKKEYKVDLYEYLLKGSLPKNHILRDGDVIFVPKAENLVTLSGAVVRPAIYELKKGEGVGKALGYAGGVTPQSGNSLVLKRFIEAGATEVIDLEEPKKYLEDKIFYDLTDGDVLTVRSVDSSSNLLYVSLSGDVNYKGRFGWKDGLLLSELLARAGGVNEGGLKERISIFRVKSDSSKYLYASSYTDANSFVLNARDSVVVHSKSLMSLWDSVSIDGAVDSARTFQYHKGMGVKDLILLAGGVNQKWLEGHVVLERLIPNSRQVNTQKILLSPGYKVAEKEDELLLPGDRVIAVLDTNYYKKELVEVSGAVKNPGRHALAHKGEELKPFLDRVVRAEKNIQWSGTRFFRKKDTLIESENIRLGDSLNFAPKTWVEYSVAIDFEKVVKGGEGAMIPLQEGDRIEVAFKEYIVQVEGEVISPGAVLFNSEFDVDDYLSRAGGLTRTGDEDRVLLTYANGSKILADDAERNPDPGSVITVAYKPSEEPINWASIFQGSIATLGAVASVVLTIVIIDDKLSAE